MLEMLSYVAGNEQTAGLIPPGSTTFHLLLAPGPARKPGPMPEASPPATDVRTLTVPDGAGAQRVDRYVADVTGLSRSYVQKLISAGHLTSSGGALRANAIVGPGTELRLEVPPAERAEIAAEAGCPEDRVRWLSDIGLLTPDAVFEDVTMGAVNRSAAEVRAFGEGFLSGFPDVT